MPRRIFQLLWLTAMLMAAFLLLLNAVLGNVNHDEGWYLHAARLFGQEQLAPYRDFAFTQGPLMPLVYAAFNPLVASHGLLGGRLATTLFGVISFVLASRLAGRLTIDPLRRRARLLAFTLLAINVYQSYFFAITKTYALASVFLLGGFLLWCIASDPARRAGWAFLAGFVLAAAAGVRLSAGIALLPAGLYLLWHRTWLGRAKWLAFGLGALASLAAIYGLFLWMCPEQLRFGLLDYHAARKPGGGLGWLVPKIGFVSRFTQAYFLILAAFLVSWLVAWFSGRAPAFAPGPDRDRRRAVAAAAGLMTLVHFLAPFPYDDYQVMVAPLLAVLAALALAESIIGPPPAEGCGGTGIRMIRGNQLSAAALVLCIAASFSSPINQDWMVTGRDRVWWKAKSRTSLQRLGEAADAVREWAGEGRDALLTQDLILAVEAGLRVPRGLEMGPFSYYPGWDREKAERLNVVNTPMLEELLRAPNLTVAAFSPWSLSIACPEVLPVFDDERARLLGLVESRAKASAFIPEAGQGHEGITVYLLGPAPGAH